MDTDERYSCWVAGLRVLLKKNKMTQAALGKKVGTAREHINGIVNNRKRAGENLQNTISRALGVTYDEVRALGREALGLPALVAVAQTGGVNHGTVAGIVQAAPPAPVVSSPASGIQPVVGGGEIERDLCERIVRRMANQTTEEKIAFHTRMKKCIEEDGLESVKE